MQLKNLTAFMILASFLSFLLLFVAIGIASTLKNRHTVSDYFLASHTQKPWMVALAAVATNNSGYMFIGMIGYSYLHGLSSFWIMILAVVGDFCASLFVYKKIRAESTKTHSLSFSELLGKWNGVNHPWVRIISAILIVIFLGVYASAQFRAGGKALNSLLGMNYDLGIIIGAAIVLFYSFLGGIRASIWINAVQSFIMISAIMIIFFSAIKEIGGFEAFATGLQNVSPAYLQMVPDDLLFNQEIGFVLFLIGWFFNGFGIIGQPHVMTTFMAMRSAEDVTKIRIYYYSWYVIFFALTVATGLVCRLILPLEQGFDPESSLLVLSRMILPDVLIGLILAGIFSSTMSAADSQLLGCSAAISNDLVKEKKSYLFVKLTTVAVTIFATFIALFNSESVFFLANLGWLALACSFAPLIIVYSLGRKLSQKLALIMMLTGFIVMLFWRYYKLEPKMYDAGPAILAGLLPYVLYQTKNLLIYFYKVFLRKN